MLKYPAVQILLILEATLLKTIIIFELNVFEDWSTRNMAILNEVFLMSYLLTTTTLSNYFFIESNYAREITSFVALSFLVAIFVMNFGSIFQSLYRTMKLKCTHKRRYRAYLEKRAEIDRERIFKEDLFE